MRLGIAMEYGLRLFWELLTSMRLSNSMLHVSLLEREIANLKGRNLRQRAGMLR